MFRIKFKDSDIRSLRDLLPDNKRRVAMQAAVSRTVTTGVALIARKIGEEVRLPIKTIKDSIVAKRGSFAKPVGTISVNKAKAVWLSQFVPVGQRIKTWTGLTGGTLKRRSGLKSGGITVRVRKKATPNYGTVERYPSAFWAVVRPGTPMGIFERTGKKAVMKSGRYKGKIREKIRRKRGPSPLGVFLNARGNAGQKILNEVINELGDILAKNISQQLDRFLTTKPTGRTKQLVNRASDI